MSTAACNGPGKEWIKIKIIRQTNLFGVLLYDDDTILFFFWGGGRFGEVSEELLPRICSLFQLFHSATHLSYRLCNLGQRKSDDFLSWHPSASLLSITILTELSSLRILSIATILASSEIVTYCLYLMLRKKNSNIFWNRHRTQIHFKNIINIKK